MEMEDKNKLKLCRLKQEPARELINDNKLGSKSLFQCRAGFLTLNKRTRHWMGFDVVFFMSSDINHGTNSSSLLA